MTIPSALAEKITTKVAECIKTASLYFKQSFPAPKVSYALRGKAAGKAYFTLNEIRLNPILLQENEEAFINEVVPHEIAHLLTVRLYGKVRPHGSEWQGIMQNVFSLPASTTHSFSIASVQGKAFEYQCACQSHPLSIRRHNRVQRQQTLYSCRKCGQQLTFTGQRLS
ncbi:SprT family zinc-dependent metalloprotease [Vibrio profundum]